MSTHGIEQQEIVERYLRGLLTDDERRAFQEHFFSCDECVEQMQTMQRFIAGVRFAAESGSLRPEEAAPSETKPESLWAGWLKPAFAFASIFALALAAMITWLALYRVPLLRLELASERQAREQVAREGKESLDQTLQELERERQQRQDLENVLARTKPPGEAPSADVAEANVPILVLEATRSTAGITSEVTVPSGARSVVLMADVEAGTRFTGFRLEVHNSDGQVIETVRGLKRNSEGAVDARLPSRLFQVGKYLVRLYGVSGQHETLVGEYAFHIRRP
jgi:putative zinc finger protein